MPYLTKYQRIQIETLLKVKTSVKRIAQIVGCSERTIYREKKRGEVQLQKSDLTFYTAYSAEKAHQQYLYNQTAKGCPLKIGNDVTYAAYIEHKIKMEHYSPCAAAAAAKRSGRFQTELDGHTIYRYIYNGVLNIKESDLPRGRKKESKGEELRPPRVLEAPSIDERPDYINDRSELGHWEMDCVLSKKGSRSALLTLTERVSREELIIKIPDKTSATVVSVIDDLEKKYMEKFSSVFKTITVDNGSEFRDYRGLITSKLDGSKRIEVYYCHPYRSGERGTNENHNGMIRRFYPKGTDFTDVPDADIKKMQEWMNNYPRAVLGWLRPADFHVRS